MKIGIEGWKATLAAGNLDAITAAATAILLSTGNGPLPPAAVAVNEGEEEKEKAWARERFEKNALSLTETFEAYNLALDNFAESERQAAVDAIRASVQSLAQARDTLALIEARERIKSDPNYPGGGGKGIDIAPGVSPGEVKILAELDALQKRTATIVSELAEIRSAVEVIYRKTIIG
jgi:hypothetical protein